MINYSNFIYIQIINYWYKLDWLIKNIYMIILDN
jgi:hypothetical protein